MTQKNSQTIRVILADDHAMLRKGLAAFLGLFDDLKLVGEAQNGQEAVSLCDELAPDVVLMDLSMPVMNGLQATKAIRDRRPQTQVIALTSFSEGQAVQDALEAGAIGYLLKNASPDDLADAIRAAAQTKGTLAPAAAEALVSHTHRLKRQNCRLTEREQEVMGLLVSGLSNKEIAAQLTVGLSTVKTHVSNIFQKLDVASRAEAVAVALRNKVKY